MSGAILEELEPEPEEEQKAGVPAWVMTFADLMTLLMCFFVLLLAFSEMDVLRFKQLSGSVREAFGVQAEIEAKTIPKGTSIIAQEFSPGIPQPTPLNVVRQFTMDSAENSLDFESDDDATEYRRSVTKAIELAERIAAALSQEISAGDVSVRVENRRVIIQLQEKATFRSGYADMSVAFRPALTRIRQLLADTSGAILVSGHTDDIPISNERFRSNWDLSTARAVSVLHVLEEDGLLDQARLTVTGHADTLPLVPNDSRENRANNRRVEISVIQGAADRVSTDSAGEIVTGAGSQPAETES